MKEERKFLEGELKFVEGKTTIKQFLKTLATELVTQQWIPYEKNPTDPAWTFDLRREVWLPSAFKPQNVRIFEATVDPMTGQYDKGDLIEDTDYEVINNIIRGIDGATNIGDHILVEVCYEAEEFQRGTFLEERLPSGEVKNVCKLKSRPQGKTIVYLDTVQVIEGEELHQTGGHEFYRFGRSPVSDSQGDHKVVVYKNETVVPESNYVIDYFNGLVLFNVPNLPADKITADYGFKTGERGAEIPQASYRMYNDRIIDITEDGDLENLDVVIDVDYYWELHYPDTVQEIDEDCERIVLKTSVDISSARNRSKIKTYYWELKYLDHGINTSEKYRTGVEVRFGATLDDEDDTTLDESLSSEWAKWSWYREEGFDEGLIFQDWLPIRYWLNFTSEYANIVLQGDPSPDIHPYKNYVISYAYVGMIKSYDGADREDLENNFAMTVSSDLIPLEGDYPTSWGVRTGTGITDIIMERTDSNIPYQAHYPSFHTSPEFMDKHFIHVSEFTGGHHFSEVTVTHAYERERGKLQGMLIGDRSSIFHLDELILNKDKFDYRGALIGDYNNFKTECGFPFKSDEKKWVSFAINAPYWFANNAPNLFYGVILRKS